MRTAYLSTSTTRLYDVCQVSPSGRCAIAVQCTDMTKKVQRLFEQFQPQNYKLLIRPDSETMTFKGAVTIRGKKTGRPSQRLTFHQKGLKITKAAITKHGKSGDENVAISRVNLQKSEDEVRLHSEEMIYPGDYTVALEFTGKITEPMHGMYPCFFTHDGAEKVLIATQFESHHAREAFPCIDEPEAKATFDLTLETPKELTVLGNTPVATQQEVDTKLQSTTFETTPIMSTYLLAFVIGELQSHEATASDGTVVRTWATVAQPARALEFATKEAVTHLDFFSDYFKTKFPIPKLDQVALPDFESGAMENWGLMTFREIALLTDPDNRSLTSEQYISLVVAHEVSHQWFGDLVTMKWWDDLWLNESFASLMEHIALDAAHPDWFQWEQYTVSDVISCSSRDVFKDVQSVHTPVNHPDEVHTLFDPAIVYAKGGRLLKMLREYIGDDAFRAGLQQYFKDFAYKNTVGDDLWNALGKASGKDIATFMKPWLSQSGMPVVSVDQSDNNVTLQQKRFVLDTDTDTSIWPVPLLASQPLSEETLLTAKDTLTKPSKEPVIINQNGSGHMLVNYTDQVTKDFIAQNFADQNLKPESRINILNDRLLLARRGDASIVDSLSIIQKSASEPRDAVWMMMSRAIAIASNLVEGDRQTEKNIRAFRRSLAQDWYAKLGWDDRPNDSPNDQALRHTALSFMVGSEDESALLEAANRYEAAESVTDLPAEQRGIIAGAMVRANKPVVDSLIEQYQTTHNPDVQLAISGALTSTRDSKVGDHLLEEALGENGFVRPQDIFRWYAYLMRNQYTRASTWQWLKDNWDRLAKAFGDGKAFDYFIVYSSGPLNTKSAQDDFNTFFDPKKNDITLRRNILVAQSEIEARVAFRAREEAGLKTFFSQFEA